MSNSSDDWKDAIGLGILIFCVALSLSTCQYVEHRIEMEQQQIKHSNK